MRSAFSPLVILAALAACSPPPQPAEPPPETAEEATLQDVCGASAFDYLLGSPADGIDRTTLPEGARIITPETMVTEDFRPERLNIITDMEGNVSQLRCF